MYDGDVDSSRQESVTKALASLEKLSRPRIRFLTNMTQVMFSESTEYKKRHHLMSLFVFCALGRNRTYIASTANLNSIH